jgi:hypothetical protein
MTKLADELLLCALRTTAALKTAEQQLALPQGEDTAIRDPPLHT